MTGQGQYLVVLQFLLMAVFMVTPVYQCNLNQTLFENTATFRWSLLCISWAIALLLGGLGSYHIRTFLTPLPYPVEHNQLVTTGVYSLVRHPLYSSQLFAASGWTLFSMSLSHLLLTLLALLFFTFKASREERWLTERHSEYTAYARKVKKFIPWLF